MKTRKIKVYPFEELDQRAQNHAFEKYGDKEFFWGDEMLESLKAFYKEFSSVIKSGSNWTDCYKNGWREGADADRVGLKARLYFLEYHSDILWRKKTYKLPSGKSRKSRITVEETDCPFSGLWSDYDLLKPLREFIKNPDSSTVFDVLKSCVESWQTAYNAEEEYNFSLEKFKEDCEANEWEFTANGTMWQGL